MNQYMTVLSYLQDLTVTFMKFYIYYVYDKFSYEHFQLDPKKPSSNPPPPTVSEPQDAEPPRSKPSAGKEPVACQHLAHMGRQEGSISWINREGSAGWWAECQRSWQLGRRHRSPWSIAARPYCWILAPHLHSYVALFAHSRQVRACDHHVTCDDMFSFALCLYILALVFSVYTLTQVFSTERAWLGFLFPYFILL